MVHAISADETYEFIIPEERETPDTATVWVLGHLSGEEVATLGDSYAERPTVGTIQTARIGLRGWRKFLAADNSEIGFELEADTDARWGRRLVRKDLFDKIPAKVQLLIGNEVASRTQIGEDDEKN